ncbi:MAG: hypothetical protein ACOX6V_01085 [Patescibacteria group bacterium]|jgi:hypothetical protein
MVNNRIRKLVKQRAQGKCEDCGVQTNPYYAVVGHLNHARDSNYANPQNIVSRCLLCETEYHLKHADNPSVIGLTKKNNDATIFGHFKRLTQNDQAYLVKKYRLTLERVLKRLDLTETIGFI